MLDKLYLIFGVFICGLFIYAGTIGMQLVGAENANAVKGRTGPSYYHK